MSFASDVSRIARGMGDRAENVAAAVIIETFGSVIRDTPALTGRLRGNWQTTKQNPASGQLDRIQKTKTKGAATVEVFDTVKKPGVFYCTNNLPYAERIEFDGWSHTKAPEGMVRKNIRRLKAILRKHQ